MAVVTAGVHHAGHLRPHRPAVVGLLDRQRVQVGPQQQSRSRPIAFEPGDHPGPGHSASMLQAQGGEFVGDQGRGGVLGEGQFRPPVQSSA